MIHLIDEGYPKLNTQTYKFIKSLIKNYIYKKYSKLSTNQKEEMYDDAEQAVMDQLDSKGMNPTEMNLPQLAKWVMNVAKFKTSEIYTKKIKSTYVRDISKGAFERKVMNLVRNPSDREFLVDIYSYNPDTKKYVYDRLITPEQRKRLEEILTSVGFNVKSNGVSMDTMASDSDGEEGSLDTASEYGVDEQGYEKSEDDIYAGKLIKALKTIFKNKMKPVLIFILMNEHEQYAAEVADAINRNPAYAKIFDDVELSDGYIRKIYKIAIDKIKFTDPETGNQPYITYLRNLNLL